MKKRRKPIFTNCKKKILDIIPLFIPDNDLYLSRGAIFLIMTFRKKFTFETTIDARIEKIVLKM